MLQSPHHDYFLQQKLRKMSKAQNLGKVSRTKLTLKLHFLVVADPLTFLIKI